MALVEEEGMGMISGKLFNNRGKQKTISSNHNHEATKSEESEDDLYKQEI